VLLAEDVVVDFTDVAVPRESPFHFGFWGAIIIRASRVHVDLRGHSIDMATRYREQQRFFALIDVGTTPLPGNGRVGFTTPELPFDDILIENGTLGESSHFGIHGVKGGRRWKIQRVRFRAFEVGAISISACSDLCIADCSIGTALPPKTTARQSSMMDLARTAEKEGKAQLWTEIRGMMNQGASDPKVADSLVRHIVIMPKFNVGKPVETTGRDRLYRVSVRDCTFDDVVAAPEEEIGIAGPNDEPLRDVNGNLILWEHAKSGHRFSQLQALLTPALPESVRKHLVRGNGIEMQKYYGRDLRGHDLLLKASLFVRIDGCDGVSLSNLRAGTCRSIGSKSAAVGMMLNDCTNAQVLGVRVRGVEITDECVSVLSNERPQSGLLLRGLRNVDIDKYDYGSERSCSCSMRDVRNAKLTRCSMKAPMTALRIRDVEIDN